VIKCRDEETYNEYRGEENEDEIRKSKGVEMKYKHSYRE